MGHFEMKWKGVGAFRMLSVMLIEASKLCPLFWDFSKNLSKYKIHHLVSNKKAYRASI